jgi:hypothetical protein
VKALPIAELTILTRYLADIVLPIYAQNNLAVVTLVPRAWAFVLKSLAKLFYFIYSILSVSKEPL